MIIHALALTKLFDISVFQLVFTPLTHPGIQLFNSFSFSMYTAPAYFACLINVIGLLLIIFFFKEYYAGVIEDDKDDQSSDVETASTSSGFSDLPAYDMLAILLCYATRFVDMSVRANLETLGSPFAMMMFNLNEADAVRFMSIAQGIVGALTFATYIAYILFKLERWVPQRMGCIISLIGMVLFHIVTYSWPFLPSLKVGKYFCTL